MVDYLDKGNRIMFEYLILWGKQGDKIRQNLPTYNLMALLGSVYKLFDALPPVAMSELFGDSDFLDPVIGIAEEA